VELEELLALVLSRLKEVDEKTVQCNLREVIDDPVQGFACIVGRDDVKNRIAGQLYAFSRSYKIFTNTFNNICLLGSPGVGKTGLAKVIGYVFSKTGILATENIKITSRSSLVGQYVGQTAPRTKSAFLETLEGILFIDEAYQLTPPDPGRDFGPEAVTELVNLIDKFIGMNVVIVAGYEKEMMTQFFPCNEGLARRFPYRLILTPYSVGELTDILIRFVEQKIPHEIDRRLANYLYSIIVSLNDDGVFENQAGDMLNLGSSLVKSINGCYRVRWEERDLEHNKPIILEGLEDFLYPKGLTLADTCLKEYQ
jgi:SpoVK/Ycf46/Vps4 family AAA+-type ATPase